jgi:hypothetical protein
MYSAQQVLHEGCRRRSPLGFTIAAKLNSVNGSSFPQGPRHVFISSSV